MQTATSTCRAKTTSSGSPRRRRMATKSMDGSRSPTRGCRAGRTRWLPEESFTSATRGRSQSTISGVDAPVDVGCGGPRVVRRGVEEFMAHKLGIVACLVGFLAFSVPLFAHHGAASFDTSKTVTVTGTVTEYIWSNPR